jgi:hypothetical protein
MYYFNAWYTQTVHPAACITQMTEDETDAYSP